MRSLIVTALDLTLPAEVMEVAAKCRFKPDGIDPSTYGRMIVNFGSAVHIAGPRLMLLPFDRPLPSSAPPTDQPAIYDALSLTLLAIERFKAKTAVHRIAIAVHAGGEREASRNYNAFQTKQFVERAYRYGAGIFFAAYTRSAADAARAAGINGNFIYPTKPVRGAAAICTALSCRLIMGCVSGDDPKPITESERNEA